MHPHMHTHTEKMEVTKTKKNTNQIPVTGWLCILMTSASGGMLTATATFLMVAGEDMAEGL